MIEFLQFNKKVYGDTSSTTDWQAGAMSTGDLTETRDTFNLPEECPKSDIVFDEKKSFKEMALALYRKYVEEGSEWEINVSYKTRGFYDDLLGDEEEWMKNEEYDDNAKMYELWDKAIGEMNSLIRAAFIRFKSSTQFRVLHRTSLSVHSLSLKTRTSRSERSPPASPP